MSWKNIFGRRLERMVGCETMNGAGSRRGDETHLVMEGGAARRELLNGLEDCAISLELKGIPMLDGRVEELEDGGERSRAQTCSMSLLWDGRISKKTGYVQTRQCPIWRYPGAS